MYLTLITMATNNWPIVEQYLTDHYQTFTELRTVCPIGRAQLGNTLRVARIHGWVDFRTKKNPKGLIYVYRKKGIGDLGIERLIDTDEASVK